MAKAQRARQRAATASSAASLRPGTPVVAAQSPRPAATSHRTWGVVAHVARCGFVVLAAGVLVGGDLGTSGAALGQVTATRSPASVLSGLSIRQVEAQHQATSARAESLALAKAALDAAVAADALSRTGTTPGSGADAGLDATTVATGAEPALTAEQSATLQALQPAGDVPTLPAPLQRLPNPRSGDDSSTDDDALGDDALGDDALDGSLHADPLDDGSAELSLDDAPLGGAPVDDAPLDDAALDDASADGAMTDEAAPSPATVDEAVQLAEAVQRLTALVTAAGGRPLGPVDVIPVDPGAPVPPATTELSTGAVADVPLDTSLVPVPAPTDASDTALTEAVREAAGEVFALSLRMEAATEAASQDSALATDTTLADLGAATASALAAADALVELEPLTESELAARRPVVVPAAPSRPATGASSRVSDLSARWSNGQIPADAMCAVPFDPRHLLQCDAAEALGALNEAYRAHFGTDMRLTDSYRSLAGQIAVKQAKGFLAATPGTSNHGWGLAIDISGIGGLGQFDSPGYLWLKEHAEDFGWHHPRGMEPGGRSPQEPWHWEFGTD